jgi:hypothetical protein
MPTSPPDHFPQAINYSLQQIPYAPHELNGVLGAFSSIANRTQNLQVFSFASSAVGESVVLSTSEKGFEKTYTASLRAASELAIAGESLASAYFDVYSASRTFGYKRQAS